MVTSDCPSFFLASASFPAISYEDLVPTPAPDEDGVPSAPTTCPCAIEAAKLGNSNGPFPTVLTITISCIFLRLKNKE